MTRCPKCGQDAEVITRLQEALRKTRTLLDRAVEILHEVANAAQLDLARRALDLEVDDVDHS